MATDSATISSSCISKGARISGKVDFGKIARIEGEAEGEITGDYIEIAPSAVVMARITANTVKVSGQVDGEIVARERIELLPTARLHCTITSPTLVVTEGAQFDGDIKMPGGQTSSPKLESNEPIDGNIKMPGGQTSSLESRSNEPKEIGLSFGITQTQKVELRERGYSDDDIALMIPAVAHRILGLQ